MATTTEKDMSRLRGWGRAGRQQLEQTNPSRCNDFKWRSQLSDLDGRSKSSLAVSSSGPELERRPISWLRANPVNVTSMALGWSLDRRPCLSKLLASQFMGLEALVREH